MNWLDAHDVELKAMGDALVQSGEWGRIMDKMREKSQKEYINLEANGMIENPGELEGDE